MNNTKTPKQHHKITIITPQNNTTKTPKQQQNNTKKAKIVKKLQAKNGRFAGV